MVNPSLTKCQWEDFICKSTNCYGLFQPSAMVTAPFSDTAPELVAKVPVLAEASKAPLDNVKPSAAVTAPKRWMHPIDDVDDSNSG